MTCLPVLDDFEVSGKVCLVRVDYNLPILSGKITDTTRLEASLPTLRTLQKRGAKIVLISHLGRPKGKNMPEFSLRPVAKALSEWIDFPVSFAEDCLGSLTQTRIQKLQPGEILLLENLRFYAGEEQDTPVFSKALSLSADLYINDAFSASHRCHASTVGITQFLPSCAGQALSLELSMLEKVLKTPQRPVFGIVGGAKISTKIGVLRNLVQKLDSLAIGGGMANTFLYASGFSVGRSLCEKAYAEIALEIIHLAKEHHCTLLLPKDVITAKALQAGVKTVTKTLDQVEEEDLILDVGPQSLSLLLQQLKKSKTVLWNGPLGAFETPPFQHATLELITATALACREGQLSAIAGGGDTVAALNQAGCQRDFTYISTAGGAFLEWIEGKSLPGIEALKTARTGKMEAREKSA